MPKYLVVNTKTLESVLVDLHEAARIAELDPDELACWRPTAGPPWRRLFIELRL